MEFKLLIDAYRQHLEAFHKEIETICSSGQRKKIPASPNYQTEVIIPSVPVAWQQKCQATKLKSPIQKPIFR